MTIKCSRCGTANTEEAFICSKCGMGLQIISVPGSDEMADCDFRALWSASLIGAVVTALFLPAAGAFFLWIQKFIGGLPSSLLTSYVSFTIWHIGPFIVASGCGFAVYVKSKRMNVKVSLWKTIFGSIFGMAAVYSITLWAGRVAYLTAVIICPFLAARFGLNLLKPWWSSIKTFSSAFAVILLSLLIWRFEALSSVERQKAGEPSQMITAVAALSDNEFFIAGKNRKLARILINPNELTPAIIDRAELPEYCIEFLEADNRVFGTTSAGSLYEVYPVASPAPCAAPPAEITELICLKEAGEKIFLAGTLDGVYLSTDVRKEWSLYSRNLKSLIENKHYGEVTGLAFSSEENLIYCAIFGGGLYERKPGMNFWTRFSSETVGTQSRTPWIRKMSFFQNSYQRLIIQTPEGLYEKKRVTDGWDSAAIRFPEREIIENVVIHDDETMYLQGKASIWKRSDRQAEPHKIIETGHHIESVIVTSDEIIYLFSADRLNLFKRDGRPVKSIELEAILRQ